MWERGTMLGSRNKKYIREVPSEVNIKRKVNHLDREARGWLGVSFHLCKVVTEGFSDKMAFEQSPEGNEGANYADIWEKTISKRGRKFWDI